MIRGAGCVSRARPVLWEPRAGNGSGPPDQPARARDLARLLADPDAPPLSLCFDVPAEDARSGYARWATAYDTTANPLIHCEEPAVRALIVAVAPPP